MTKGEMHDVAQAEYREATAPALAEYEKAIAPSRAEYDKAAAAALVKYREATALMLAEYKKRTAEIDAMPGVDDEETRNAIDLLQSQGFKVIPAVK